MRSGSLTARPVVPSGRRRPARPPSASTTTRTRPVSTWSPSATCHPATVPGRAGVHVVLHLHGLEDHQDLAGLDPVAAGHGHPHDAPGQRGQRGRRRPAWLAGTGKRSSSTRVEEPSGPSTKPIGPTRWTA